MLKKVLLDRYVEICKEHQDFLSASLETKGLSKLHLGGITDEYESATNKILIIGRETRTWLCELEDLQYDKVGTERLMNISGKFLQSQIRENKKNSQGASFFNFVRQVAKKSGASGILWSNIYTFDYKGGHIKRLDKDMVQEIESISKKIIIAQIEVLNPDIIIFATGNEGVATRRRYFPNSELKEKTEVKGVPKKDLWAFKLPDYDAQCYRIHHPSAFGKDKKFARQKLIELLPSE